MYYGLSSAARSFCSDYTFAHLSDGHDVHLLAFFATFFFFFFSFFLSCTARLSRSFRCCCGSSHAYDGALSTVHSRPPGNSFYMDTAILRVIVIS
ncbi:hypothetical protein ASPBRDRAFT_304126 [Aspergillus brasiliensis CBS 101740]|uniref:Uncharacterized protein n=1 Tax=Aspergillus brasiliensis (strain CBS 101740 / IMI 381727 / IBT 21946) TaxID=767769 RepID=A0A1L9UA22_ASPBC|nr:hypothetical protein ASPBRDRAFT_304126 [Aspergillus brasiliensis CBS 101740]